jgi:hypothetical protein
MRIHLLDIASSSGIRRMRRSLTDPYGEGAVHGTSVPCQGLSMDCPEVARCCCAARGAWGRSLSGAAEQTPAAHGLDIELGVLRDPLQEQVSLLGVCVDRLRCFGPG